ncbi:MAG: pantoate--beta-alanine ligase [Bacteroidia bacterium]
MYLFQQAQHLQLTLEKARSKNRKIGFVPTMGALHEGHLKLVQNACDANDLVVCSIFVNPAQFNDPADLAKYPRTIEKDLLALSQTTVGCVYIPDISDVYPDKQAVEKYNFGRLESLLEGAHRPGHFEGVGMVVARLLRIVQPQQLYLGEKDYQQCLVIRDLLRQMKLDTKVELHICPTSRNNDGLALSSRNQRLTENGKHHASQIYTHLLQCRERYPYMKPDQLSDWAIHSLECTPGLKVEYFSFADAETLEPVNSWNDQKHVRVLVAVWLEGVRLIDNALLF